jgi:hypothetical protein
MPMLTTSLIGRPVKPCQSPARTRSLKPRMLLQHGVDLRHHVRAVDQDRPIRAVAQRHVQHGAIFGAVDSTSS